jgi:hypothetical protein
VYGAIFALVGFFVIWKKLGGWPEAYYRIRRIEYFVQWVWGPTREPGRWVHKTTIIDTKKNSFRYGDKDWQLKEDAMGRDTGRPAWYYLHDETEPLPLFEFKKGAKMTPDMITAAYENDCIERVHRIGMKGGVPGWFWVLLVVAVVVVIVAVSAYFNYNTYCAVKPSSCGTGGVRIG